MASIQLRHFSREVCAMCGKGDVMGSHRPHSLHKTKRVVKPNLQTKWGYRFCQNCFRTLKKKGLDIKALKAQP